MHAACGLPCIKGRSLNKQATKGLTKGPSKIHWPKLAWAREGVADLFVSQLTVWAVSFNVGSGDWASGLYGIVEPCPAIVMVTRDISRAKFVLFMHVYFKFVAQVGEILDCVGAVHAIILCVKGLQ
eukprot:1158653-Pelagomonas_calceolata.AAC.6